MAQHLESQDTGLFEPRKAASDMEPFWLAASSTDSIMLWADVVWQI